MFLKNLLLTTLLLAAGACSNSQKPPVLPFSNVKPTHETEMTPLGPKDLTKEAETFLAGLNKIEPLSVIFPSERLIELESTDQSLIAEVSDVVLQGNHLFVLDEVQAQIFEFDQYGAFKRRFGQKGQGPNEYESPQFIKRGYGDHLLVLDAVVGKIKVFGYDGTLIKETPRYLDGSPIYPSMGFSWKRKERLFLGSPSPKNPKGGDHLGIDTTTDEMHKLAFFGRPHILHDQIRPRISTTAFNEIGDLIWAGSPYESHLKIYDRDGNDLGFIGKNYRQGKSLKQEDWDNIDITDRKEVFTLRKRTKSNHCIHQVGDYALVHLWPNLYELYDLKGNLIRGDLAAKNIFDILDTFDNRIVSVFAEFEDLKRYTEDDFLHMDDVRWSPEKMENANSFLRIGVLAPVLQ